MPIELHLLFEFSIGDDAVDTSQEAVLFSTANADVTMFLTKKINLAPSWDGVLMHPQDVQERRRHQTFID